MADPEIMIDCLAGILTRMPFKYVYVHTMTSLFGAALDMSGGDVFATDDAPTFQINPSCFNLLCKYRAASGPSSFFFRGSSLPRSLDLSSQR